MPASTTGARQGPPGRGFTFTCQTCGATCPAGEARELGWRARKPRGQAPIWFCAEHVPADLPPPTVARPAAAPRWTDRRRHLVFVSGRIHPRAYGRLYAFGVADITAAGACTEAVVRRAIAAGELDPRKLESLVAWLGARSRTITAAAVAAAAGCAEGTVYRAVAARELDLADLGSVAAWIAARAKPPEGELARVAEELRDALQIEQVVVRREAVVVSGIPMELAAAANLAELLQVGGQRAAAVRDALVVLADWARAENKARARERQRARARERRRALRGRTTSAGSR